MIRAKADIIAGGKRYKAGQGVKGLSAFDQKWMKEAGYIEEEKEKYPEDVGKRGKKETANSDGI